MKEPGRLVDVGGEKGGRENESRDAQVASSSPLREVRVELNWVEVVRDGEDEETNIMTAISSHRSAEISRFAVAVI